MQYGSQRQTGQQPPSSQSLGAPHPNSTQVIYTHGPLTAAPTRPIPVHCTRRHPQPRTIYTTQVPVMQYQFNQRQPSTVPFIQAQGPGAGPYQYQPAPTAFQTYSPYYIPAPAGNIHTRGPPVPLQMGHTGHPPPPQTQPSSHQQTSNTRTSKSRPNAIAIINPNTFENVLEKMVKEKVAVEEETTPVVVSAICDGPSVEIPLEQGRRKG